MSVLIHVQHLLGSGHLHRAALIAREVAARGIDCTVASGGFAVPGLDFGGARLVQLPAARSADAAFKTILDDGGRPIDDAWRAHRRAATLALWAEVRPRLLLTEMYPFGRRQFRFELEPLVAAARTGGAAVWASVRDILIGQDKPGRADAVAAVVNRDFERVLAHGDPRFCGFAATFPRTDAIADRLIYTGFVVRPIAPPPDERGRDEVLVSAGGGAVGQRLFETALAARAISANRARVWRFLVGAQGLRPAGARPDGVIVEPARPDFTQLLANCHVSVSQAGYNTVMEILATRARAVVVPFADGNENEQTARAGRLAAQGALHQLPDADLTPRRLAAAIDAAAASPRPDRSPYDLAGAAASARMIAERLGA